MPAVGGDASQNAGYGSPGRTTTAIVSVGGNSDPEALPLLLTLLSAVTGRTTTHAGSARQALPTRFVYQLANTSGGLAAGRPQDVGRREHRRGRPFASRCRRFPGHRGRHCQDPAGWAGGDPVHGHRGSGGRAATSRWRGRQSQVRAARLLADAGGDVRGLLNDWWPGGLGSRPTRATGLLGGAVRGGRRMMPANGAHTVRRRLVRGPVADSRQGSLAASCRRRAL